ncbi:bile acid:sodium symporter family protein [Solimonas terrae]|uniref:Bile acid:sodium symporter n=1 Tax=Solimonas terrae TaxID=1396819 RepID=A0A6M2BUE4_9GAMM|nr:bile acid:sodium symporter family protein [Solimonas terrae]NGY05547.1 bile acid:sodium symporter [Solimonas terrae]
MRIPFLDGFLASMLIAIAIALLMPQLGASGGVLHLDTLTHIGVALVFLLSGAGLSTERLKAGAANWRLHLFVQLSTFAVFPLVGLLVNLSVGHWLPRELMLGFFYLCALPSTVSSSIAMTAMARGNIAGAVFNATLSSLIGMLLTPLYVSLFLSAASHGAPLLDQFIKIGEQLLLPFVVGQCLRPWIGDWITRNKPHVGLVDRAVIVMIVFNSFCDATRAGVWTQYGAGPLLITALLTGALLAFVLTLTHFIATRLRFAVDDEIAAVFCGSKKSLAAGAPMAALIFGSGGALGLIMLPIMIYHQLQLITCSVIARRYARRPAEIGEQAAHSA